MEPNQPRVVVIDALHDAADSLALLIGLWGYDAEPLYDADAALASARALPPLAVVMDVRTAGDRFAAAIRALPGCGDVPVVAVTGYASAADRTRASHDGVDHYLTKPVDPDWFRLFLTRIGRGSARTASIPEAPGTDPGNAMRGPPVVPDDRVARCCW